MKYDSKHETPTNIKAYIVCWVQLSIAPDKVSDDSFVTGKLRAIIEMLLLILGNKYET